MITQSIDRFYVCDVNVDGYCLSQLVQGMDCGPTGTDSLQSKLLIVTETHECLWQ